MKSMSGSPSVDMPPLAVGEVVKFIAPLTVDEANERFIVLEHRGPRTLVEAICDMQLRPKFVYLTEDLVKA